MRASSKRFLRSFSFSIFELAGITKNLATEPAENTDRVLFPIDLNVPLGFAKGNIKGVGQSSRGNKLTISLSLGPVIH